MNTDLNINDILLQVEQLDREAQQSLFEKLALMIRKPEQKKSKVKLSSISGLGASVWSKIDIDDYVDHERQW
ncbi:hypothetical protein LX99_03780 [Mucilaginibacter oryzae]|uniref:DUF2281 domain-containing protein n=1 Tax=Mucilaginibacter oryzae TaxID=468058 RepID=A0A316H4B9_9SPHI|nr:hypothetical protein [Mucilaginibacter oryzae]PWK75287.1 hypothetical protein LX99_03780 [Mucilaginibacter oryzae]